MSLVIESSGGEKGCCEKWRIVLRLEFRRSHLRAYIAILPGKADAIMYPHQHGFAEGSLMYRLASAAHEGSTCSGTS